MDLERQRLWRVRRHRGWRHRSRQVRLDEVRRNSRRRLGHHVHDVALGIRHRPLGPVTYRTLYLRLLLLLLLRPLGLQTGWRDLWIQR